MCKNTYTHKYSNKFYLSVRNKKRNSNIWIRSKYCQYFEMSDIESTTVDEVITPPQEVAPLVKNTPPSPPLPHQRLP